MQLFNYLRVLGAMTDSLQLIEVDANPRDRQEKRMISNAISLMEAGWGRREVRLKERAAKFPDAEIDWDAERARMSPQEVEGGKLLIPLQYLENWLVRRIAAVQANASIHSIDEVTELKEVFSEFGVKTYNSVNDFTFSRISWAASGAQKPKVLLWGETPEGPACIRFEAAGELAQKALLAIQGLGIKTGDVINVHVDAEDPSARRNKAAGKEILKPGIYVDHNLRVTRKDSGAIHFGRPPKGERFVQKPTMDHMEHLFKKTSWTCNIAS